MKILIIGDNKTERFDYIKYDEPGPVPPLVNPPNPSEPKDELPKEGQEIRKRKLA